MAAELQQRVIAFNAGDEKYAGEWLTQFQRAEGAWEVCIEALSLGVPESCDQELLQEFCAQTLGRLARSFADRLPADKLAGLREQLQTLLVLHCSTRPALIWKQIALALTCADLWLGRWSPQLAIDQISYSFPSAVRRELLSLPVELLFCDSALPLDDARLRATAASSLLDSAPEVLPMIIMCGPAPLTQGPDSMMDTDAHTKGPKETEEAPWVRVLASWLSALRKAGQLLPGRDEVAPLRCLAEHIDMIQSLAYIASEEAVDVVQELARWRDCDNELGQLLRPLLQTLFSDMSGCVRREALLPLLTELASDVWPRAVLGDFELDWPTVMQQAISIMREALENSDGDAGAEDAEACMGVWETFACTLRYGTRESRASLDEDPVPLQLDGQRPEKRRREQKNWHPTAEKIHACDSLPTMFGLFAEELVQLLCAPFCPSEDDINSVWALREEAQAAIAQWVAIVAPTLAKHEATWTPLHRARELLTAVQVGPLPEDIWREVEATLWLYGSLARHWPANAGFVPFASLVLEMQEVDHAPDPWKALLWSSAGVFASLAPAEQCRQLVEWMLVRSPAAAGSPELLSLLEKPYAEALEKLCGQLPQDGAHVDIGERLAAMAFAARDADTLHSDFAEARRALLRAMRYSLGNNSALLCQGLAQQVLPQLRQQTDTEADTAPHDPEPQWNSAQSLFGTLAIAAPAGAPVFDTTHAAAILWSDHWSYVEAALTQWKVSSASDEPVSSAADALWRATIAMPILLPRATDLLARSVTRHELPDAQLVAFGKIVSSLPCPAGDAAKAAELLSAATQGVIQVLGDRQGLYASPSTLSAFFSFLAEAVAASPAGTTGLGPCGDMLRPLLLAQAPALTRAVSVLDRALPECRMPEPSKAMLNFLSKLLPEPAQESSSPDAAGTPATATPPQHGCLAGLLPSMLSPLCRSLASQEQLSEMEHITIVAEIFSKAVCFTAEFGPALTLAMAPLQVPEWSRARLQTHIVNRSQFAKRSEWVEQLQQIIREWQREVRRVALP